MAGRKRRASTSSVETVDGNQIRWLQESSVLRTPPSNTSIDNLPVFELRDAVVLNKDGETLENALHVVDKGPYIVRGHLVIDEPSQRSHLIMRVRSSVPIEIRRSVGYSIGEAGDGRPLIWVQGKSAWYEIEPSPTYRPIYNKMCEATTLYYHVMDIYRGGGLKKSKKSKGSNLKDELSDIFLQYAVRIGDGATFDEVIERCGEHAFFFFWQFTQENPDDFDWKSTGFYKWLVSKHADVFKKAKKLVENPPKMAESPPRRNTPHRSASPLSSKTRNHTRRSVSATMTPEIEPSDSGRQSLPGPSSKPPPPKRATSKVPLDKRPPPKEMVSEEPPSSSLLGSVAEAPIFIDDSPINDSSQVEEVTTPAEGTEEDAFSSVLAALEWVYTELAGNKKGVATVTALNKVYFAYKFPDYRDGSKGSYRKPVEEVFHYNAKALLNSISKDKYGKHEFYTWLQQMAETPFLPKALSQQMLPFQMIPRANRPQPITGRPAPVKAEGADRSREHSRDADGTVHTPRAGKRMPGQRSGKKSGLRLATSQKRSHSALDSDSDSEGIGPGPKRSHYFSDDDEDMENAVDVGGGADPSATEEAGYDTEPIKFFIQAERIPSTKPLGPNGTWTCEENDCDYIVRGGDEQDCQARILKHFHEHERTTKVNLALAESRGHLPINHLLDKIKTLGEKAEQNQRVSANGVSLPQHIKRKLPI